jgi:plastocyanin
VKLRVVIKVLATVVLGIGLAGCGGNNKVGNNSLVNFKGGVQQRLGATTTTVATATTVGGAGGHLGIGGAPSTTVAKAVVTTQAPQQQQVQVIDINGDNAGTTQFDPTPIRVAVGTVVKWVNKDSVPRSVESDTGAFSSGPIAPGATWPYKAATAGQFNYHDGTRPYAIGSLEVVRA